MRRVKEKKKKKKKMESRDNSKQKVEGITRLHSGDEIMYLRVFENGAMFKE